MIEPEVLKCLFVSGFWPTKIYLPRVSALNNANINFFYSLFFNLLLKIPIILNTRDPDNSTTHHLHQNNNSQLAGYGLLHDVGGFDWKQNTKAETVNLMTSCSKNREECEEKASQGLLE